MTSFIVTIIVLFLGKFIWDSYITDNTEKNWVEYKQQNPVEADRIESNSGLNFRTSPIDRNLVSKPGDLKIKLSNFLEFYSQLDSNLKARVCVTDSTRFEFKMPITFYGNTVGYNHIGIRESFQLLEIYFFTLSSQGTKINLDPITIEQDLETYEYEKIIVDFYNEVIQDNDYLQISLGAK